LGREGATVRREGAPREMTYVDAEAGEVGVLEICLLLQGRRDLVRVEGRVEGSRVRVSRHGMGEEGEERKT
jgi:hypothetical protein